jgi:nitrogen fixation protein NifX
VNAGGAEMQQVVSFDAVNHDGNEQKLPAKIAAISGCAAIFCLAVGGSAIKQLVAGGVQPVKVNDGATIHETLAWLQKELTQPTTPWVAKALAQQPRQESAGRFDAMAAEGWDS